MITILFRKVDFSALQINIFYSSSRVAILRNSAPDEGMASCCAENLLAARYLNSKEINILNALHMPSQKRDFVAGRVLAKQLLMRLLEEKNATVVDARQLVIDHVTQGIKKGKPLVKNAQGRVMPWNISLSHKDGAVLVAVTETGWLGVDVENIFNAEQIANPVLFPSQDKNACTNNLMFCNLPIAQRATILWCTREAIGKLCGVGFRYGLNAFIFENFNNDILSPTCQLFVQDVPDVPDVIYVDFCIMHNRCYVIAYCSILKHNFIN